MKKSGPSLNQLKQRSEYEEQCAIFDWAAIYTPRFPELEVLHASTMGGVKIPLKFLNKMAKSGMKKGKPDIFWPVARQGFHGLWIELKRRQGSKTTAEQIWWGMELKRQGYDHHFCKGSDQAIARIISYGQLKI